MLPEKQPMSDFQNRTIQDLYKLRRQGAQWHAIRAAGEIGIFGVLDSGQKTVTQIAETLSLNEDAVGKLMQVLLQTAMVEQYGDDYALTTLGSLVPTAMRDFGNASWEKLVDHLKTGEGIGDETWQDEISFAGVDDDSGGDQRHEVPGPWAKPERVFESWTLAAAQEFSEPHLLIAIPVRKSRFWIKPAS